MIRPLYKLKKCPVGVAPGKYSASVMHDYALGTQQVVQEQAGTDPAKPKERLKY